MPKQLKDILSGVKSSKKEPASLGKDPGVDYKPKAGDEAKFADKHEIEVHADRVGNDDDVYKGKTKEAPYNRQKKDVYEAKEVMQCNETPKGTECPVHGMSECWSAKKINEKITKDTSAGEMIHDFVHSDNPKFAGKSKEKRKQMALAAYYSKQRNEEVNEDLAVPLVGANEPTGYKDHEQKPRGNSDEAVQMVKSELRALANKAMHLAMAMTDGMHVEPWVQTKIAQAKSYVSDVHDYMVYTDHDKEEEDEETDTPMTFPNMSVDVNTGHNV